MNWGATKAHRRFTSLELVVYVSLFGIAFAMIRCAFQCGKRAGPSLEGLLSLLMLGAFVLLGALIGVAAAVLLGGRRRAVPGAVVGGIVLPLVLFFAVAIVVYHTHNRPRTLVIPSPDADAGLKA